MVLTGSGFAFFLQVDQLLISKRIQLFNKYVERNCEFYKFSLLKRSDLDAAAVSFKNFIWIFFFKKEGFFPKKGESNV